MVTIKTKNGLKIGCIHLVLMCQYVESPTGNRYRYHQREGSKMDCTLCTKGSAMLQDLEKELKAERALADRLAGALEYTRDRLESRAEYCEVIAAALQDYKEARKK